MIRRIYPSHFGIRGRLFRCCVVEARNMGCYLRIIPSCRDRSEEYVDLCAQGDEERGARMSFYLSFHEMDVKVERYAAFHSSAVDGVSYLPFRARLTRVQIYGYRWHIGPPPVNAAYVEQHRLRRKAKPAADRLVALSGVFDKSHRVAFMWWISPRSVYFTRLRFV